MLGDDTVDEDGQSALPRVQVVGSDTLGSQGFEQQLSKVLEGLAGDSALLVAVSHVVDVAQELQLVVHGGDDDVEAVSDEGNLLVELGVSCQVGVGDLRELGKVLLETRSASEQSVAKWYS